MHGRSHRDRELDPPLLALQRISVTVSCVRLVVTSVGAAPVAAPPEAHLTLCSRLESLPRSAHWAVQHASVNDDGLHLSQAIRSGQAAAVSDASLHGTSGTSSTVVEGPGPEHRLLCHAQVPGPVKEGDSLRCELAGNYSVLANQTSPIQSHKNFIHERDLPRAPIARQRHTQRH